ncbi:MAG: tetratricopeptide repeat protein [Bacteroidales bacterium]|nr:tetratricopeptide repeat protein [Bacteroidales bacterium]
MNVKRIVYLVAGVIIFSGMSKLQAQDNGTQYGENPDECKMNFSLYRESFKQWKAANYQGNVNDFLDSWRHCFTDCPRASEYIYLDGVNIMEYFSKEGDPAAKEKYADTLEMVFDNRIKYFPNDSRTKQPQEGTILWRKAMSLDEYVPERVEKIYNAFKRAVELDGNNISSIPISYYLKSTIDMSFKGNIEQSVILDTYDQLSTIVDFNLKKCAEANDQQGVEEWTVTMKRLEQLIEPFASCEDLVEIFQKKFDTDPQDIETLRKITGTLDKNRCTDNTLFMNATENLFKLDPDPQSAYMMAKIHAKNGNYDRAAKALEEVIKLTDDDDLKYKALIDLTQMLMMQKKFSEARNQARRALQMRPNSGEVLILIGKMYAMSSDQCGTDDISKKAVFWPAVDKFNEAKRIDPSVTDEANKLISTYRQYFPAGENLFFNSLNVGDSYKVECWIGETTTVRSSD